MIKILLLALAAVSLTACTTIEAPRPAGALRVAPRAVTAEPDRYLGSLVQWGGKIIATYNRARGSELEVLAYPLDRHGKPRTDAQPEGRFLLVSRAFLDPLEYASGRLVTASGRVRGLVEARVGAARHAYPRLDADSAFLWPRQETSLSPRPTIHLGIGSGGAWGGIGIGF